MNEYVLPITLIGYIAAMFATMIGLAISVLRGRLVADWGMVVGAGVIWPITLIVGLVNAIFYRPVRPVAICSRCHGRIETFEHVQSGEDYGFGIVCEDCFQQLEDGEGDDYEI